MARPTKNSAEYFSHDADMRNDVKVKALRRNFKHKGYAVWCFILEVLTDADFFEIDFDEMTKELLAADFDVDVEELEEIVEYCVKINLLQITDENRIYSSAHKRRFSGLLAKRERDRERLQRIAEEEQMNEEDVITTRTEKEENSRGENAQSKVKETKAKETKAKYPYQGICDLWNEICVSLPQVQKISGKRKDKMKCRCEEWGKTEEEWMATASELFRRIQASDFLTGRSTNKREWTANFDWVFENDSNWIKVMEGNYDNEKKGCASSQKGAMVTKVQLGVGEFYDNSGRRTYGTGKATIPPTAPPRPSDKHAWDAQSNTWILL